MFKTLSADKELSAATTRAAQAIPTAPLSLITTLDALRALQQKWRALESQTQNHTSVFQSFDWVMAWAETYIGQKPGTTLHILAGYEKDDLVFIWPLMRSRRFGFSVLSWLTDPFGQYGDVLCRKGESSRKWIESSIAFLNRLNDVDILRLRHVRADSHMASHAASLFVDARMPEGAPCLDLTQYANEEAYDGRYTSVQRKRRKKIRKSLEDLGPVTFKRLPAGSDADFAVQQAMAEKSAWLADRGRINRVLSCLGHTEFMKRLSRNLGGTVDVVVTEVRAGDKPVSWEIGFRHKNTHYGYITSHVNTLTDVSPGRLHMDLSQRACLNDGMAKFDLMVPNDTHKESWSSHVVATNDYFLPLSLSGSVIGYGYLRCVRPILRNIYYRLDATTLRKLNLKERLSSLFKSSNAE
jgi:CelD/BcsL family acetyltransferase involved in cellulose biosynthesis